MKHQPYRKKLYLDTNPPPFLAGFLHIQQITSQYGHGKVSQDVSGFYKSLHERNKDGNSTGETDTRSGQKSVPALPSRYFLVQQEEQNQLEIQCMKAAARCHGSLWSTLPNIPAKLSKPWEPSWILVTPSPSAHWKHKLCMLFLQPVHAPPAACS